MSTRHVFRDRLLDQGSSPADEIELLRHAVRLSPATGEAREDSDAVTRTLANEVRESMTFDEGCDLLFPSRRR